MQVNMLMISIIPDQHDKIAAIDASFIEKSSKHTKGLAMFWSGASGESKKDWKCL